MLSRFIFLFLLVSFQSFAAYYKVIASDESQLDVSKRTHIVIASRGNDLGYLPQLVAGSRALKIADMYPEEQVLIFLPVEQKTSDNEIRRMGFTKLQYQDALLNSKKLVDELIVFTQIVSFHTFGHGAIIEGVFLDAIGSKDVRWYPNDSQWKRLAGHFSDDAFATLNGCNAGHQLAPYLSKLWKIPVSGALTGTHFETVYDDGSYYWYDELKKKSFAKTTGGLLSKSRSCLGACYRMRPDNHQYKGHYGAYQQGLPMFKFFCGGLHEDVCLKGMARSIFTQTSTQKYSSSLLSKSEYSAAVREWLCPAGMYRSKSQANCMQRLDAIGEMELQNMSHAELRAYTPFRGTSSHCSFNSCYVKPSCQVSFQGADVCAKGTPESAESDTFVSEYLNYLKGYDLLVTEFEN